LAAREVEQVVAFGLVELERAGESFEHELGDSAHVAALEALVVLDADTGERGDLLAAQAFHASPAVGRQARLLGRDLRPPRRQELGDVAVVIHQRADNVRAGPAAVGCPAGTPFAGSPTTVTHALS